MKANPRHFWPGLCLSAGAILVAGALTSLITPLVGGPAITENPSFHASSITIGGAIYIVFRLTQRRLHQRTLSKKD